MRKYLWAPLLGGLALFVSVPVRGAVASSGADIVYSARYYKPGREVSRYHLWRIRADGAGRVQVTADSRAADYSPVWLADGRTVLFVREEGGTNRFCTVNEDGGPVTTIAPAPGSPMYAENISPDRRFCTGDGRDLAPLPDKREVWVSPLHIVSLEDGSRTTIVQGLVSVGDFDWRPTH